MPARPLIDEWAVVRALDERIARTTNPRHARMLDVVRTHLVAEATGDSVLVMETLGVHPIYKVWGGPEHMGLEGRDALAAYYAKRFGENRLFVEFVPDHVIVDDDAIVTDLRMRYLARGEAIRPPDAYPVGGVDADPDDIYLVSGRLLVIWPFDESLLLTGEEAYTVVHEVRLLTPEELGNSLPEEVRATFR